MSLHLHKRVFAQTRDVQHANCHLQNGTWESEVREDTAIALQYQMAR